MTDKIEVHSTERKFLASEWREEFTRDDGSTYLVIHHSKYLDQKRSQMGHIVQDAWNWV